MGANQKGARRGRNEHARWRARAIERLLVRAASLALLLGMLPGCSGGEGEADANANSSEGISSDGTIVCGSSIAADGHSETEWYSLIAMNNKLLHFPDFAKTKQLSKVKTCAEARNFAEKYSEYSNSNPEFDRGEPIDFEALSRLETPPPPTVDDAARLAANGSRQKIRNGNGDRLSPVVRLTGEGTHAVPDVQGQCTGVFIGRNWIMTAAHCLQTAKNWVYTKGEAAAKIHGWYQYRVEFAKEQGLADRDPDYWYVLQYFDPRYIGFKQANRVAHHDFALLYVIDSLDNGTPNNDPNASFSGAAFMRVGLKLSVDINAATFWGTGPHDPPPTGADPILLKGSLSPYASTFTTVVGGTALFTAQVPAGSSVPWICHGDSGGPLVDRYNIRNPDTGVVEPQYVASGLLSAFSDTTGADIPNSVLCADQTKYKVSWTRLEDEKELIENWVSKWYKGFPCKAGKSEGASSDDYLQCWGKPCKDSGVCADNQYCYRPGSQLKLCTQCGSGSSSCDCIYGQCMPKQD